MLFEVANILRRAIARGDICGDVGRLAHHDVLDLPVSLIEYSALAGRAWELRGAVTVYGAGWWPSSRLMDVR